MGDVFHAANVMHALGGRAWINGSYCRMYFGQLSQWYGLTIGPPIISSQARQYRVDGKDLAPGRGAYIEVMLASAAVYIEMDNGQWGFKNIGYHDGIIVTTRIAASINNTLRERRAQGQASEEERRGIEYMRNQLRLVDSEDLRSLSERGRLHAKYL